MTERKAQKRKPKRRIRKSILVVVAGALLCGLAIWLVPGMVTKSQLKKLGYDKESVKLIIEEDLSDDILSHQYHSEYLEQVIDNGTLHREYMYLYTVLNDGRIDDEKDLLLYNRLVDRGYETDQLVNLYNSLTFRELTPLLVFDYQWNEQLYIDDCLNNRENNTGDSFTLSDDYITYYRVTDEISKPTGTSLINQTHLLSSSYVPEGLTALSDEHAVEGVELCEDAAEAFTKLSAASVENGHSLYASAGYTDYASQDNAYTYYVNHVGALSADYYTERAGASEHQSGTAVNIALTYENTEDLVNTEAFQWLRQVITDYGFIIRYPDDYSYITGRNEPKHLRYLGKKLAKKVEASSLSYDEYYELYLASWDDENLIPSTDITSETDYDVESE